MSIESEITRLVNAKSALRSWLVSKGVGVPGSALLPDMVELLDDVQTGSGTAEQLRRPGARALRMGRLSR